MIEHWYEYLPAAWFTPQGKWIISLSILVVFLIGFAVGLFFHIVKTNRWLIKHNYKPSEFFNK